jgi:hypothetical protein
LPSEGGAVKLRFSHLEAPTQDQEHRLKPCPSMAAQSSFSAPGSASSPAQLLLPLSPAYSYRTIFLTLSLTT